MATATEIVYRPRNRRAPFNRRNPVYPGEGCRSGAKCDVCPRWRCPGCLTKRPWCFGCDGERPELCDDCAEPKPRLSRRYGDKAGARKGKGAKS